MMIMKIFHKKLEEYEKLPEMKEIAESAIFPEDKKIIIEELFDMATPAANCAAKYLIVKETMKVIDERNKLADEINFDEKYQKQLDEIIKHTDKKEFEDIADSLLFTLSQFHVCYQCKHYPKLCENDCQTYKDGNRPEDIEAVREHIPELSDYWTKMRRTMWKV